MTAPARENKDALNPHLWLVEHGGIAAVPGAWLADLRTQLVYLGS
jgi:hypothetical protein